MPYYFKINLCTIDKPRSDKHKAVCWINVLLFKFIENSQGGGKKRAKCCI